MLVLTREIGQSVQTADGSPVGDLLDLTIRLGLAHPRVERLAVGHRRAITHLVPWPAVATFEHSLVQLRPGEATETWAVSGRALRLEPDELLLVRDVLDTQIIDVTGHRMARVADVLLTRLADQHLEVAAVDVGFGQVCRRLGLSSLARRMPERAVDWPNLHLTSDRGHVVQLGTTAAAVHRLDARELAELLTRLGTDDATEVIDTVGPERAAAAVAEAHPDVGGRLLLALDPTQADQVVGHLPPERARHFRRLLRSRTPLTRRRFTRTRGWRLHRPGSGDGGGVGAGP